VSNARLELSLANSSGVARRFFNTWYVGARSVINNRILLY
jgi:hypothetical protein